jgi:Aspartyl/asparaginyl-tRNA synthetases
VAKLEGQGIQVPVSTPGESLAPAVPTQDESLPLLAQEPAAEDLFALATSEGPRLHTNVSRNQSDGFVVLGSVSEFYPHPAPTPVQLAGRVRNLQTFRSSADKKVGYFELFDASGTVRVYVPADPYQRFELLIQDGNEVVVRGVVRRRDGRQVCDALEIISEGGIGFGKASANRSSARDP